MVGGGSGATIVARRCAIVSREWRGSSHQGEERGQALGAASAQGEEGRARGVASARPGTQGATS